MEKFRNVIIFLVVALFFALLGQTCSRQNEYVEEDDCYEDTRDAIDPAW